MRSGSDWRQSLTQPWASTTSRGGESSKWVEQHSVHTDGLHAYFGQHGRPLLGVARIYDHRAHSLANQECPQVGSVTYGSWVGEAGDDWLAFVLGWNQLAEVRPSEAKPHPRVG